MKNVHEPRKTNKQEWNFLSFSFIQNEEEKEIIFCYVGNFLNYVPISWIHWRNNPPFWLYLILIITRSTQWRKDDLGQVSHIERWWNIIFFMLWSFQLVVLVFLVTPLHVRGGEVKIIWTKLHLHFPKQLVLVYFWRQIYIGMDSKESFWKRTRPRRKETKEVCAEWWWYCCVWKSRLWSSQVSSSTI